MSSEQAQSYFLDRQNSYHQNLHALGRSRNTNNNNGNNRSNNNNGANHPLFDGTPRISNSMRNSTPNTTASATTTSPSLLDSEEGEKQCLLSTTNNSSSSHNNNIGYNVFSTSSSSSTPPPPSPSSQFRTIRFQVVVWNIGKLDVVTGSVPMTFRVSLFWNDNCHNRNDDDDEKEEEKDNDVDDEVTSVASARTTSTTTTTTTMKRNNSSSFTWKMCGRTKAIIQDYGLQQQQRQQQRNDTNNGGIILNPNNNNNNNNNSVIDVPPLSILNVATFETIGGTEIDLLEEKTRLFRWTAMYRATVLQSDTSVKNFPHDVHQVQIKLAILSQRSIGRIWDSTIWKLALATEYDSQYSTRVPYGLIVDQVKIPGFTYNNNHHHGRGLQFEFCPLNHGSTASSFRNNINNNNIVNSSNSISRRNSWTDVDRYNNDCRHRRRRGGGQQYYEQHENDDDDDDDNQDYYLRVYVTVLRESGYYDQNIVPLVALLNVVAVSVLTFQDTEFFYRALITLNIAFVEMSIRMTADSHLPSVGYQIKLQKILNEWFVILMMLVLESMTVYVLNVYFHVNQSMTKTVDWVTAIIALGHNISTTLFYYQSKSLAKEEFDHGKKGTGTTKET